MALLPHFAMAANPADGTLFQQWLVLGPLDCPPARIDSTRTQVAFEMDMLGDEAGTWPKVGDAAMGRAWIRHNVANGFLQFEKVWEDHVDQDNCVAYAAATVTSETGGVAFLSVGSDDAVKVWVNGTLVHEHFVMRGTIADDDLVRVHLVPGENRLLFKIINGQGNWGLMARILDDEALKKPLGQRLAQTPLAYQSVFSGKQLPAIRLDVPQWAELFVTLPKVEVSYFDAQFNKVTEAVKPGRYGALVRITPAGDDKPTRTEQITLYRTVEPIQWRRVSWDLPSPQLPDGLGINQDVADANSSLIAEILKSGFIDDMNGPSNLAQALAVLSEVSADAVTAPQRIDARTADRDWWIAMDKKLGISTYQHVLHTPKGYKDDPGKKWPLLLQLHGAGSRGNNLDFVRNNGPLKLVNRGEDLPFIILVPQCPRGEGWYSPAVMALVDEICAKYRVDESRIYCAGMSMGGYGTWGLAMTYPDRFAAIAPICGGGEPEQAFRLKDLPTWVFHGAKDNVVPLSRSQVMVDAMRAAGAKPVLTIYPDAEHDSWTPTYDNPKLYSWLLLNQLGKLAVWPDSKDAVPPVESE